MQRPLALATALGLVVGGAATAAIAATDTFDHTAAPKRIVLARDQNAAPESASLAGGEAADDAKMIAPFVTSFELVGELPSLEDQAHAYVLRSREVTREDMLRLAEVFGLTGEPTQDEWGSWSLVDGNRNLWAYGGPGGSWSYYDQEAGERTYGTVRCPDSPESLGSTDAEIAAREADAAAEAGAAAEGSSGSSTGEGTPASEPLPAPVTEDQCDVVEPTPAASLPSQAEAEAQLRQLLDRLGIELGTTEATTYSDQFGMSISLDLLVEGETLYGYGAYANFGDGGLLISANGYFGSPERADEYPLIGTEAGFARLQDQYQSGIFGFGGEDDMLKAAEDSAIAVGEPVPEPAPDEPVIDRPVVEEQVVRIVSARLGYVPWYGTDQDLYILPAYVFVDENGGEWSVPAVADEYLGYDETPAEPLPTDLVTPEVEPADDVPAVDTTLPPAVQPEG